MKKLYSVLLLAIIGLVSFGASAIGVTFKTNNAGSAVIINGETSSVIPFEGIEATLDITGNLIIYSTGNYELISVVKNGDVTLNASNIEFSQLAEGDVVTITTKEKESRTLTIVGNADHMYVSDHSYRYYYASDQTDGAWIIKNIPDYSSINVYANSGYTLTSVKDDKNNELQTGSSSSFQLYSGNWEGAMTIYVESANLNDLRNKSVTIKVEGTPSDVKVSRQGYNEEALKDQETTYKFFDDELPIYFSHASYNKTLYKVTVAGVDAKLEGSYYKVSPNDGDIIEVKTSYPDIDVPVKFNFSNDNLAGIVNSFRIDGENISDWNQDNFTAKLGSKISMSFNSTDYDITSISVNGDPLTYFYSYEFSVTDANGYTIDINATKKPDYQATIYCENYEKLLVYNGSGYSGDPIIELTGVETVVNLAPSRSYLTFKAKDSEYTISSIDCTGSCTNGYQTQVQLTGTDAYIEISLAKVERPKQAVVYLDPETSWNTDYSSIRLSPYKDTEYDIPMHSGYQIINFGDFDTPANISLYTTDYSNVSIYQNGQDLGLYVYQINLEDGDVIKAFGSQPATHTVSYDIADGLPVKVFHDHITEITHPASHEVFAGTEIHIKPVIAPAQSDGTILVEANGEKISPDDNGIYVITVKGDTRIKASINTNTGIENLETGADSLVNVYNLQGIEVLHMANPEQIKQLPAGIYLAGGKKIVVR